MAATPGGPQPATELAATPPVQAAAPPRHPARPAHAHPDRPAASLGQQGAERHHAAPGPSAEDRPRPRQPGRRPRSRRLPLPRRAPQNPHGGYEIADLGSHNGTYVNGQRVGSAPVTENDVIGIGHATFRRVGGELQEFIDTGDISLEARGLTVTLSSGKVILDDVSFPLSERCLLGVIGPSGAGKSTLLGA